MTHRVSGYPRVEMIKAMARVILWFAILSFMGWYANSVSTKKVGIRIKFYPAHYIMPSRKMRKIFKLDKKEIPKWMYFSLYLSFVYIILFLIFVLYVLIDDELTILQVFLYGYGILMVANIIYLAIFAFMYKI